MKKTLLMFVLYVIGTVGLMAQQSSMTDDQVMQFVISEHNAGVSQAKIVEKLMKKGVDINQIRRIRQKYEKQVKSQGAGAIADEAVGKTEQIMRTNNGKGQRSARNTGMEQSDKNPDATQKGVRGDAAAGDEEAEEALSAMQMPAMQVGETLYKGNKVFGRDIFNNTELTFEPAMNIATPQNYVVGPGDNIKVDIYGASQKSDVYTVSPDGDITVPGFGPINLSGLTVSQATARLRSTLGSRYSSSSIKASLGQTRTITVNVMGEVRIPGTYTLSAFASVFHALYMAGGISEIGTLRNIKVYRNGKLVTTVDVYDYILNGKLKGNVRLADNDVIVVGPFECMTNITGKVKRPMYYEMKRNESVGTLLKYAGGFESDAYTKSLRVVRNNGTRRSVFNVNEFDMSSFRMADGDVVSVDSILDRFENMVEVKGAVFRPGMYQLGGELTTVRGLLEQCDGVTEEAFTARGVMHRMNPDRTLKVMSVDVEGILNGTSPDIALQNEDVLFIPTKNENMTERTITIHGEVNYPGIYKYADNETLEDFVLQAGGLKETASTVKVDVARRIYDSKALTSDSLIAKTYSFSLREGFVVDGEQGFVLKPFDEVYVRRSPGYATQQNVSIMGEVNFPGSYTLSKRETRLSDIVKAAGGPSITAYVKGARLERTITNEERIRMQQVMKMAKMKSDDKDSINTQLLDLGEKYYVGIQLDKAIENPGSDYDLVLRENDRIIVPEYINTVKISGDVPFPNTVAYKKGENAKYYINQAGGFGQRAKKSHTYIVHMNGTVNQMGKGSKPTPGSEIIVPTKPKTDAAQLSQWLAIGTSTASIATMIATIANLIK
ncbi:MAG: SLBB domain-containing protein [Prevotellaceae bacterium]|nr:SLBB domain-containing protein [Prevotellaceae bacterium]MDO4931234.1 SLBB domain-containing protein [Prevotellaceae bacterium]